MQDKMRVTGGSNCGMSSFVKNCCQYTVCEAVISGEVVVRRVYSGMRMYYWRWGDSDEWYGRLPSLWERVCYQVTRPITRFRLWWRRLIRPPKTVLSLGPLTQKDMDKCNSKNLIKQQRRMEKGMRRVAQQEGKDFRAMEDWYRAKVGR